MEYSVENRQKINYTNVRQGDRSSDQNFNRIIITLMIFIIPFLGIQMCGMGYNTWNMPASCKALYISRLLMPALIVFLLIFSVDVKRPILKSYQRLLILLFTLALVVVPWIIEIIDTKIS